MAVVTSSVLMVLAMLRSASSDKWTRGWSGGSRALQSKENGCEEEGRWQRPTPFK
jgi:hypothetical protein